MGFLLSKLVLRSLQVQTQDLKPHTPAPKPPLLRRRDGLCSPEIHAPQLFEALERRGEGSGSFWAEFVLAAAAWGQKTLEKSMKTEITILFGEGD